MTVRSRVTQDRRMIGRVATRLECQFDTAESSSDAVIIDLSLRGAYLSAKSLPSEGAAIRITINTKLLDKPLTIQGMVKRSIPGMSDHGRTGRIGVEFNRPSLELSRLISQLVSSKG